MPDEAEPLVLPLAWVGLDEQPILYANQFLGQANAGEITLTIGQAAPPALLGSPEQQREQAEAISYVPVRPLVRVNVSRDRLEELIQVLTETLQNADARKP